MFFRNNNVFSTFVSLGKVFKNPTYSFNAFTMVMAAVGLFSYIASSPFIIQEHYGFSPLVFSLCFGVNSVAIAVGAILSMKFKHPKFSIITGSLGMLTFAFATALCLFFDMSFIWFEVTLMLMLLCIGLILPAATALAMDAERDNAGAASAVIGSLTFLAGSICTNFWRIITNCLVEVILIYGFWGL